jgi:ribonuclease D
VANPWVRTPEALVALARTLEGCRAIGLDTESDSLYHHFDKVCLLQLATDRGEAVLVDTLAVRDLSPLAPALADPALVKVLHGADYDVSTLKRDFGFAFASLFDTMIAARLLGKSEVGLAALARDELGVVLSKDSQKDDWSRRPLTAARRLTPRRRPPPSSCGSGLGEARRGGALGWLNESARPWRGSSPPAAAATTRPTST